MNIYLISGILLFVFLAVPMLTYMLDDYIDLRDNANYLVYLLAGHIVLTPVYSIFLIIFGIDKL